MAAPTTNQAPAIFYRIIASNGFTIGPRLAARRRLSRHIGIAAHGKIRYNQAVRGWAIMTLALSSQLVLSPSYR